MKDGNVLSNCILLIDGGTTNTRFTLMEGEKVLLRTERKIGAADKKQGSQNELLRQAVKSEIQELQASSGLAIGEIYASGMITSANGLMEIPHILAPAGLFDLARCMHTCNLEDVSPVPFRFVPGIKFTGESAGDTDMLRGEEAEVFGAVAAEDTDRSILFLHFGSHNKLIHYQQGKIVRAITTMSGELLWALKESTILKSSLCDLNDFALSESDVLKGFQEVQDSGLTRTLFETRILNVLHGAGQDRALSFLYGALMASDMQAFAPLFREQVDQVVLYGRDRFVDVFGICAGACAQNLIAPHKIRRISFEDSQWLSVKGMQKIRKAGRELQHDAYNT
jgi:2-dehydro-3-deoxygalactonokinase